MFKRIADNNDPRSLAVHLRRKRFALFQSLLSRLERPVSILDIGGTELFWRTMGLQASDQVFVTVLNISPGQITIPNMESRWGDARSIQVEDQSFDVAFSNSVIEHVGSYEDQKRMAGEVQRVGQRYFIQTPNKHFPLEPHFLFPFFQFLPVSIRILMVRNFKLGWYPKTPDPQRARALVEEIRLLGKNEFTRLFPGAHLYEEKILGLTKSFVAYRGWNEQ
jgi:hypothetical protein